MHDTLETPLKKNSFPLQSWRQQPTLTAPGDGDTACSRDAREDRDRGAHEHKTDTLLHLGGHNQTMAKVAAGACFRGRFHGMQAHANTRAVAHTGSVRHEDIGTQMNTHQPAEVAQA